MKTINTKPFVALSMLAIAMPAQAHHFMGNDVPSTFTQGMLSGLAHPIIGVDHLAFVLMLGLLVVALKGSARYLVPGAFVAATIAGTAVHLSSASLPASELIVAFSIIGAGALVLLRKQLPALLLGLGFTAFGVFHGYAYGEAIVGAETTPIVAYLTGFSIIQYAVILGIALGMEKLAVRSEKFQQKMTRGASVFATLTGAVFLALNIA